MANRKNKLLQESPADAPVVAVTVPYQVADAPVAPVAVLTQRDMDAAEFFNNRVQQIDTGSAQVKALGVSFWADSVTRYVVGFTWETMMAGLIPAVAKSKTFTSVKAIIVNSTAAGISLVDADGKAKGKTALELERGAKENGVNLKNADGTEKTQKELRAQIKAAKDETSEDVGHKGETVPLTDDQTVDYAMVLLATDDALIQRHARQIGACVLRLQELASKKQKAA